MPVSDSSASTLSVENRATGYFVTVTAPDIASLSVDATPTGQTMVSNASTVNVVTNAPSGYKLYISASSANLTSSDTSISQSFSPVTTTTLTPNTWGYSLDTGSNKNWHPVPEIADPSNLDEAAIITAGATDITPTGADTPNYPNGTDISVFYGINSTTDMPSATYTTTVTYTAFGEGIPPADITGATYMQDVTLEMCNATDAGTSVELLDKRGYGNGGADKTTTYTVIKARDGNCWMADNLNLYNVTVQAADSDFTSGSFTIPNTSNWTSSGDVYDAARMHVVTASSHQGINYYNWCTATAHAPCGETTQVETSICPNGDTDGTKGGWKLPVHGDSNTDYSWLKLMNAYGVTNAPQLFNQTELGFTKYYGHWHPAFNKEYALTDRGYFITATPRNAIHLYVLFYDSGSINKADWDYWGKDGAFPMRCVVR